MLTPDYASPEQVTGGAITTATDIYSLGAVLYKLLTGASPHQFGSDSGEAVALAISHGRITAPSKLAPYLKGDLEIILMKALRKEARERYDSVEQFSEDLESYLESRPIRARRGETWYRARKYLRRHWLTVCAATLAVGGLCAGVVVANHQRMIAERRFSQLRQLSNRVIDVDRAIRTLPGSVDARRRLVGASLEYLEGLSLEARGNLDLAQEIADGYWRMARIQGVNAEFNMGDPAKAEESLKKADALIDAVLASRPRDRGALFRSAVIANDRMMIAGNEAPAEFEVHAQKALRRLEQFRRYDDPGHPVRLEGFLRSGDSRQSEQRGAATIYSNLALAYVNAHSFEEGARYARLAVELARPIPSAQDLVSSALSVQANALRHLGDLEAALPAIREARRLSEQASFPNETARMFNLYGPLLREGRILGEYDAVNLGRQAEAVAVLQKAMDMSERAARNDAKDSVSRSHVGTTARELGDILRDHDPRRALAVYDLGIHRLAETQTSLTARRDRAVLLAGSSYPLRALHRASEAKLRIDASYEILKETRDYPAERIRPGGAAHHILCARADYEAATGDVRLALQLYEELLRKEMAWPSTPEASLSDAVRLSTIYTTMAGLYRRADDHGRASELKSRRLALWSHWDAKLPHNSFVAGQLNATKSMAQ